MKQVVHPVPVLVSKEELVKHQLQWILHNVIKLNDTDLTVLAYVFLHGRASVDKIVEDGVLTNSKTVENYISRFRKKSLITGMGNETQLNEAIKPEITDVAYTINFKLND